MRFIADVGGGVCRHCRMRLPEWDTREHCDACLQDCWEADHGRYDMEDDDGDQEADEWAGA